MHPRKRPTKAAEEAASYNTRLAGFETRVVVVTWMVWANITMSLLALGVLITFGAKLGEISGQLTQLSKMVH